jgi:hypothetical protein
VDADQQDEVEESNVYWKGQSMTQYPGVTGGERWDSKVEITKLREKLKVQMVVEEEGPEAEEAGTGKEQDNLV